MKIRTDFVTNSSSSSFVAMTIKAGTLESYLSENGIEDIFEKITWLYEDGDDMVEAELDRSFSQSLVAILEKIIEKLDFGSINEELFDYDEDVVNDLIRFLKKNKEIVDAEAEGSIELKYSDGEDGYAYVQSLVYKNHHGKLIKWPCEDGWNCQEGGGYGKIQDFNSRMFNGEIQELADLAYDAIWDIVWDDEALDTAIEKTGIVKEFDVTPVKPEVKADMEKDLRLEDIDPVNTGWISGGLFVLTGLGENEEAIAKDIIGDNGGIIKSSVVLKTNYVIYNPYYGHETTKLKKAHQLIEEGKPIQLLTVSEFCKKLITSAEGTALPKAEKKAQIPVTLKECKKIFDCDTDGDHVEIRGIKKSTVEVVIPGVVDGMPVIIAQGAFEKNRKLEKVIFSEGVQAIASDAFSDCKQLKEVVFASSIQKVGSGIFSNTPWMTGKGNWFIVNGILVSYTGEESDVVIPEGVTTISDYAFSSMDWSSKQKLKSVVIPETVTYIGTGAFNGCKKLIDIKLPNHEIVLGANPFSDTAWANSNADWIILNGVLLGVTDDYYYSHYRESTSLTIPEGVKTVGKNSHGFGIRKWENVKKIVLPEGLVEIDDDAFSGFKNLEEINFPSTLVRIGNNAFTNCSSLANVVFPDGLKEIGTSAFSGMAGWGDKPSSAPVIEEVILPDTVEKIGNRAFACCERLKKLRLPKVLNVIPAAMVHTCKNLFEVEMPEKCRIIEADAFESCQKLENLKLPEGVTSLGRRAFYGCISLKGIDIPLTIKEFGWATFKRCDSITSVIIPEGVTELPEELFLHCDSVVSIKVPSSVVKIEGRVFEECPRLTISVSTGSVAEKYAKDNGIPYVIE